MSTPATASGSRPHGGQHRETSAHIVGNDERRVSLLRGERLQRPARLVGDGHDTLRSLLLAVTLLDLGLYEAERDGRLGRRARLRNHDGGDRMLLQRGEQFGGVILRNVLSGENDRGVLLLLVQEFEGIAHGFEHGLGAEVRAADADADDHVGLRAQFRSLLPDGVDLVLRNRGGRCTQPRKSLPAPLPECSRALAACALASMSAEISMPVLAMSNFTFFIISLTKLIWLSVPACTCAPRRPRKAPGKPCRRWACRPGGGS